jgi:aspartyl-tRNA(Asn)/glutamyl-tRNA(Gln) amidotransferase subunit B
MTTTYETVIGLEIHVQLNTASKAFCADSATFGADPNTHVSIISLAHPGTLPRLNRAAVEAGAKFGLAVGADINLVNYFDRKNYFYADLPKGYQITQDARPICVGGRLRIQTEAGEREIRLHHAHLEEDAGKSIHDQDPAESLIDLNRAGVPLLEIVTEPDLRSAAEASALMEEMRRLVRWIDISDGNMEEGSMRCDVNISVRPMGSEVLGKRCEIKNVNSMRFARKAIEFEVARQIDILEKGGQVEQETRGYDVQQGITFSLREKEQAHDYRYFPEPDLPPVVITPAQIEQWQQTMPELPQALQQRLQTEYAISPADARLITQDFPTADYFLKLIKDAEQYAIPLANLLINKVLPWAVGAQMPLTQCPVSPQQWKGLVELVQSGQVSATTANQRLFSAMLEHPHQTAAQLATELNLIQTADTDFLGAIVDEVLARYPDKVAEYRKGKKNLIGLFMGDVMKAAKGKAEPGATKQLLEERLSK